MLIGCFQIHVGRVAQLRMHREHRLMRNAAVDPHVDGVVAMRRAGGQAKFVCKIDIVQFEPNVRAMFSDEIG